MSVTCGRCSTFGKPVKHDDVDAVRRCYAAAAPPTALATTQANPAPSRPTAPPAASTIPVGSTGYGYYALVEDGVAHFYRVRRPSTGKYAGRTFVDAQASDDFHPLRGAAGHEVLARIAAYVDVAAADYGSRIGKCSTCRRTLTDQESIDRGRGPDCQAKREGRAA
jgi:hypothetical protein